MNVLTYVKPAWEVVKKESPKILMALGTASFITSLFLVGDEAPKAKILLEKKKEEKGGDLTPFEKVKEAGPVYIPAVTTAALSLMCFAGSHQIVMARQAALIAAYKLSEGNLADLKEAALKTVGERKLTDIQDNVAKEKVRINPPEDEFIISTEHGNVICYDSLSGRYFYSDMEWIRKAQNDLNFQLFAVGAASLNDFYDCLGLPWTESGKMLGWQVDRVSDQPLDIRFTATLDERNRPVLVLEYKIGLAFDYDS